jgi:hypothetical protein
MSNLPVLVSIAEKLHPEGREMARTRRGHSCRRHGLAGPRQRSRRTCMRVRLRRGQDRSQEPDDSMPL